MGHGEEITKLGGQGQHHLHDRYTKRSPATQNGTQRGGCGAWRPGAAPPTYMTCPHNVVQ
eukprot:864616-Pelagomonas_calceolata.AAC.2